MLLCVFFTMHSSKFHSVQIVPLFISIYLVTTCTCDGLRSQPDSQDSPPPVLRSRDVRRSPSIEDTFEDRFFFPMSVHVCFTDHPSVPFVLALRNYPSSSQQVLFCCNQWNLFGCTANLFCTVSASDPSGQAFHLHIILKSHFKIWCLLA